MYEQNPHLNYKASKVHISVFPLLKLRDGDFGTSGIYIMNKMINEFIKIMPENYA